MAHLRTVTSTILFGLLVSGCAAQQRADAQAAIDQRVAQCAALGFTCYRTVMKRALALIILLLLLGWGIPARAYHSLGQGAARCDLWTEARRKGDAAAPQQWALGFLSGVGFGAGVELGLDPLSGASAEGVWTWLDRYCQANPSDTLSTAAQLFALATVANKHPAK